MQVNQYVEATVSAKYGSVGVYGYKLHVVVSYPNHLCSMCRCVCARIPANWIVLEISEVYVN